MSEAFKPAPTLWQDIVRAKRAKIDTLISAMWVPPEELPSNQIHPDVVNLPRKYLTPTEQEITEHYTAQQLIAKIANRDFWAEDVTRAFCKRAAIAHRLVNCLSEVMFDAAIAQAQTLDQHMKEHGSPIGPLHGLPISLKDQFRVRDVSSSVGYVAWLKDKETASSESWLVNKLRDAGAVIYVKTNVPASLMTMETNNNIIGYTWNPNNRLLSSGGSSGGEAALIRMKGSLVGFGTDIGASIRYPAGVCGIVGIKPSHERLPYLGLANSMNGQTAVSSAVGPLARSISDLRWIMQQILAMKPWLYDSRTVPLPWRSDEDAKVRERAQTGGLAIGVLRFDGIVQCHPPIQRALQETVEKLQDQGHQVIEWKPPSHSEAFDLLFQALASDGGAEIHSTFRASGEPIPPQISVSYGTTHHLPSLTMGDLWSLQTRIYDYQTRYLEYWNSTAALTISGLPVDAILVPLGPTLSFKPEGGIYFGYTGVGNLLDVTAGIVQVSRANSAIDSGSSNVHQPVSDLDRTVWDQYDSDLFDGMPVPLQVWGRKLEEEKVLALMEEIEKCVGFDEQI